MDIHGRSQPWGKLVKVDTESEVLLVNREYTVGRRKGCDLSFPASKLVSGDHCKIVQDERSGLVWLEDTSTNGTVINMSKLVKKQVHMLQNGDVIYFVYRKNEPELTVSVEPFLVGPPWEQQALEEPQPSTSSSSHHLHTFSPSAASLLHSSASGSEGPKCAASSVGKAEEPNSNLLCSTDVRQTEAQSGVTMLDKEEGDMEPESKRRKTDGADKNYDFGLPHTSSIEVVGPAKGTLIMDLLGKAAVTVEGATTDKMEESLTCIICQDLLHDCVSLQPCMHTFCAACYSGWMERSSLCPTCRCPVERIRKNHILNNLVEAYLIQNPEKCRSEEDLKSMDSHNKITRDMLQPKIERSFSDEEGSSDYLFELSDNDSDTSDISQPFVMCRQCPGYRKEVSQVLWAIGPAPPTPEDRAGKPHGERPSTSSRSDLPTTAPREYMCPPQGSHVICTCCLQPMPDRRAELSAQQCVACQRPFCHMYWGCQRIGCQGCLARFNELNLTDKCLDGVLNSNNYESEILQNYLAARGMSWRDMLQEGLRGLQQGTFYLSDYRINSNAIMCFCCGLRAFKELAYKYRQNIPGSELPAAVTSRPDCYWGRNCRTQVKAHHATKFNHICEQTRFKS
ncbi:E3 ubiquitin-protein ligase CHFR isoform X4 [Salmo salar]|uniref:E3 ubiquitin-protein ligase CHFR n=1 Tax=Salmo salar TaxID=8030 RepID=A0A1S3PFG3_SALSA|nr:E3 ubiquitin-protein ligase CHFR isoform X4 [Salmo salar]|eukprot:XP_014026356.1 PREDICTED: E3 ubiquitin-protein ligase CHFR isoform X4 [Salmo salar]